MEGALQRRLVEWRSPLVSLTHSQLVSADGLEEWQGIGDRVVNGDSGDGEEHSKLVPS